MYDFDPQAYAGLENLPTGLVVAFAALSVVLSLILYTLGA